MHGGLRATSLRGHNFDAAVIVGFEAVEGQRERRGRGERGGREGGGIQKREGVDISVELWLV